VIIPTEERPSHPSNRRGRSEYPPFTGHQIKTDPASGIVNDPNAWGEEHGDPRYVVPLVARIVAVSLETVHIVETLPRLGI
jgi:hypothetical protein